MFKRIVFIVISIFITKFFAQAPDTLWTRTFGGAGRDECVEVFQTTDA